MLKFTKYISTLCFKSQSTVHIYSVLLITKYISTMCFKWTTARAKRMKPESKLKCKPLHLSVDFPSSTTVSLLLRFSMIVSKFFIFIFHPSHSLSFLFFCFKVCLFTNVFHLLYLPVCLRHLSFCVCHYFCNLYCSVSSCLLFTHWAENPIYVFPEIKLRVTSVYIWDPSRL